MPSLPSYELPVSCSSHNFTERAGGCLGWSEPPAQARRKREASTATGGLTSYPRQRTPVREAAIRKPSLWVFVSDVRFGRRPRTSAGRMRYLHAARSQPARRLPREAIAYSEATPTRPASHLYYAIEIDVSVCRRTTWAIRAHRPSSVREVNSTNSNMI